MKFDKRCRIKFVFDNPMAIKGFLKKMPRDMLNHTFSFLDPASVVSVCLTCKSFKFMIFAEEDDLKLAEKNEDLEFIESYPPRHKVPLDWFAIPKKVMGALILVECIKIDFTKLFKYWSNLAKTKKGIVYKLIKEIGLMRSELRSAWWLGKLNAICIAKGLLHEYMNPKAMRKYFEGIIGSDLIDKYKSIIEVGISTRRSRRRWKLFY